MSSSSRDTYLEQVLQSSFLWAFARLTHRDLGPNKAIYSMRRISYLREAEAYLVSMGRTSHPEYCKIQSELASPLEEFGRLCEDAKYILDLFAKLLDYSPQTLFEISTTSNGFARRVEENREDPNVVGRYKKAATALQSTCFVLGYSGRDKLAHQVGAIEDILRKIAQEWEEKQEDCDNESRKYRTRIRDYPEVDGP